MAFTGIMCTEAEIDQKTGANVDVLFTDVMKTAALLQIESKINVTAGVNFSDTFATLNADVKGLLNDIASSFVACAAISYNMLSYTSLAEAQTMLDLNFNAWTTGLSLIKAKKGTDFITGA